MNEYEALRAKLKEIGHINAAAGLMMWDQEVQMRAGSAAMRAQHLSALQGLAHHKLVAEAGPLIQAIADAGPDKLPRQAQRIFLRTLRDYTRLKKVPNALIMDLSQATSEGYHTWAAARAKADFATFRPALQRILDLRLQEAEHIGYEEDPYDALLDPYEPDMRASILRQVFEPFKAELRALLTQIASCQQVDDRFLSQRVGKEAQMTWGNDVLRSIGFDLERGRLDLSIHPFSLAVDPNDVRLTTRVDEMDIRDMLYSTIHEAGHGMYEQGLPTEEFGNPAGEACSLGIHESQSRLWENNVARSLPFWEHFFPQLAALYPDRLRGKGPDDLFRAVNLVQPGFIRIAADELTYHFHILLRTELEIELVNRRLKLAELPQAWNAKVKEYLGLEVPDDAQGLLQDIHWSHGSIGYFPTYSLGSFYAAQFMQQARQDLPGLDDDFRQGNFTRLKQWLNTRIHADGKLSTSEELCKAVTGTGLDVKHFIRYAKAKFGHVYDLTLA